jgi:hypothetical protein
MTVKKGVVIPKPPEDDSKKGASSPSLHPIIVILRPPKDLAVPIFMRKSLQSGIIPTRHRTIAL